jgi:hypothetical protein
VASHILGQVHESGSQRVGKGTVVVIGEANVSAANFQDSRSVPVGRVIDQGIIRYKGSRTGAEETYQE